jgi:hypothetical protein
LIFFPISFFTNALYCLNLLKTSPLAFKMYTYVDESYEVSHFIMHDVVFISSHTLCAQSLKVLKLALPKRCYLIFFANALFTHILRKCCLIFLPMHYLHMSWDLSLQHLCCFVHLQYYPVFFGIRIFLCCQAFNFYMIKINCSYKLWCCISKNFKFNRHLCWNNESNLVSVHLQVRNRW